MRSLFIPRILASVVCCFSTVGPARESVAALGDVAAQYSFSASSFTMHPTEPYLYVTIPSQNSVAIVNTDTLAVEGTVFVGSAPLNLALSPDGSKAYIANSASNFVVVLDTQSRTIIDALMLPQPPRDVVFGNQNRLFVLTGSAIYQIDASTGASTGPNVSGASVYYGTLEISPDRNTLYYGHQGGSPTRMYKFDVSGATPVFERQAHTGDNGRDLSLSHSGNAICHPNGAPYHIALYRVSDFTSLGTFVTGSYPAASTFSPDDAVVYASVSTERGIKVFDTNSFLQTGQITGPEVADKLMVDPTGRYLFAGYNLYYSDYVGTRVYHTGRVTSLGAVSRKTHGSAGFADIPLPLTGAAGIECRAGGATSDHTLVVIFAAELPSGATLQAEVISGSAMIGSGGVSNGGSVTVVENTVTIPLTNVASGQTIAVRLNGIPNGATTATMTIPMSILIGDANADRVVNSGDAIVTRNRSGADVNATNFRSDVNADGSINAGDSLVIRNTSGSVLPATAP